MNPKEFPKHGETEAERYSKYRWWLGMTMSDLLDKAADLYPRKEALIDDRIRLTYAGLRDRVDRLAVGLIRLGLEKGDTALLQLPNWAEFVISYFALQKIGCIPVLLISGYRQLEVSPLEKLNEMQQLVQNYPSVNLPGPPDEGPKERIIAPSFIQKWQRYVQLDVNEYSATSEWVDAQKQHIDLMKKIPLSCRDVLDLGCGDGWSTNQLRQLGKNAIGVTINPKEADHALKAYGLQLVVCDMHDLTLPDCCFDMIYCRECYENSVAPYIALCEMNRVLRPNGYALINLPCEEWIRENLHFSVFSPAQMREMFYKCRFIIPRIKASISTSKN